VSDYEYIDPEDDKRRKQKVILVNFRSFDGAMRGFQRVMRAFAKGEISENVYENWLKGYRCYKDLYRLYLDKKEVNEIVERIERLEEFYATNKEPIG